MIINKFISSREIIDDVYRHTGATEDLNYADCLYWVFEALQLMGQPIQYIKKVTGYKENPDLNITDYRAQLPCDLYKIVQIAVNGLPARYANNTFHHLLDGNCCGVNASADTTDVFIDNFGNQFSPQLGINPQGFSNDLVTFDINNDYLTLSVKEGKVCIAYLAIPTDDQGWPMFPDDMSYRVALRNYLTMKIAYINWIKDPTNSGKRAIFEHADKEWCWYVGQATSKVKMPDLEEMESIKNQHLRLIPKINQHNSFFTSLGAQELRKVNRKWNIT